MSGTARSRRTWTTRQLVRRVGLGAGLGISLASSIDSGTTSAQLQYAGFAIDGTADLPAGGTIRVECLSSVGAGTLPLVGISLVAEFVAGISTLP